MERGEVWWAQMDDEWPVVLLSGEEPIGRSSGDRLAGIEQHPGPMVYGQIHAVTPGVLETG